MIFTSLKFAVFLMIVLTGYYIIPKKVQWVWLLVASYFFYINSKPEFAIFLLISTFITYSSALFMWKIDIEKKNIIDKNKSSITKEDRKIIKKQSDKKKLIVCIIALIVNFGILGFLKYYNFIAKNIIDLFSIFSGNMYFSPLNLLLPLGISFYTFQSVGYCIDVYRGLYEPEKNFAKYALFVSFFPQMLQGPISRFEQLEHQFFEPHYFDYNKIKFGLQRALWGCFKKLVIADRIAFLVDNIFNNYSEYVGFEIGIAVLLYAVQIYADFSGCMDIALGIAEAMGIEIVENFNTPYFSKSVAEFWRRWHITLGSWFKDYLFYSVLRSEFSTKVGKVAKKHFSKSFANNIPTFLGLICVWFLTGLWHGSAWHYIAWGVYHGFLIISSIIFTPIFEKIIVKLEINVKCMSYTIFQILRTFLLVCFGYIFFRANSLTEALRIIKRLFAEFNPWIFFDNSIYKLGLEQKDFSLVLISIVLLFIVSLCEYNNIQLRKKLSEQNIVFRWIIYFIAIFSIIILGIYGNEYNASNFIYMQF